MRFTVVPLAVGLLLVLTATVGASGRPTLIRSAPIFFVDASRSGDDYDIYRIDSTGRISPVASTESSEWSPRLSPDGRLLAFVSGNRLTVSRPDGSNARKIAVCYEPSWAPDSRRIACSRSRPLQGIYVTDLDGNAVRLTTTYDANPVWSPEGSRIAFVRGESFPPGVVLRVVVMKQDGSEPKVFDERPDGFPTWSPDGRWVLLPIRRFGQEPELVKISRDGTNRARLLSGFTVTSATWSPNGREIALALRRGGRSWIATIRPNGKGLRRLTSSFSERNRRRTISPTSPVWSPTGVQLAYKRHIGYDRGAWDQIWRMRRDGARKKRLVQAGWMEELAWAPGSFSGS